MVQALAPRKAGLPLQAVAEALAEVRFHAAIAGVVIPEGRPELANIAVEHGAGHGSRLCACRKEANSTCIAMAVRSTWPEEPKWGRDYLRGANRVTRVRGER